jgi:5-methylcytosine-specific restriction endonuclease McrA
MRGTPEWEAWIEKMRKVMQVVSKTYPLTVAQIEARKQNGRKHAGIPLSAEHRLKVSLAMKGIKRTPEHQAKLNAAQTGKPKPESVRRKISATLTGRPGRPNSEQTRALMSIKQRERWSSQRDNNSRYRHELKDWRKAILERDEYRCVKCFSDKDLHAHHIKPWDQYPNLRFDLENGQALCRSCHLSVHNRSRKLSVAQRMKISNRVREWWSKRKAK